MGETSDLVDYRDLRPKGRPGDRLPGDRREGPRRAEERNLHYATELLLATACLTSDRMLAEECSDEDATEALLALARCVEAYRACAAAVYPSRNVTEERRQS